MEVYSLDDICEISQAYGIDPSGELHEDEPDCRVAEDDLTGEALDTGRVKKARKDDVVYFKKMQVYEKVPIWMCEKATGQDPISVRWVDINKRDQDFHKYRSRLVARESSRRTKGPNVMQPLRQANA